MGCVFLHSGKLYPPRAPTRNNFKHRGQCPSLLDKQLGTSIPTISYNMGSTVWQCRAVLPDHDVIILTSVFFFESSADTSDPYVSLHTATDICSEATF